MLARRSSQQTVSVRYYLWREGALFRLPSKLHHQLLDRDRAIPRFAGTGQKLIEVFSSPITSSALKVTARGLIMHFDQQGYVDLKPLREAATEGIGQAERDLPGVIDIQPRLRQKRFAQNYVWTVPTSLLERIKEDLVRQPGEAKIPPLLLGDLL